MNLQPLIIEGDEQSKVDPALADAGLPPTVGVQSFQVFRASKVLRTDGLGYTYHHHVDMACWKGRLYVGWNSCERDEDVWPARELYSTSVDGINWSEPGEMFPQGTSTCLRMYFFLAKSGRMLVIAGLRVGTSDTDEDAKGGLVVREILPEHRLGKIFTLRVVGSPARHPPMFEQSSDAGFVAACRELLADTVFLEQQDRGRLLGERRMKWHDPANWPGGKVPGDNEKWVAGKAYSFFRRPDGVLVGVSKMGWVTTSRDDGKTWEQPLVPSTLVTGKAKVWSQRTRDGRYALAYNPSTRQRFPLIVVASDDGEHFKDMRIVQGELPRQRYEGKFRSIGPQYVRGIAHWADDGSRDGEKVMWLVYSMSKEDIWVTRVPLPVKADATGNDELWNVYSPKWAPVTIEGNDIRLEDCDPYDHASATRIVPDTRAVTISFEVTVEALREDASERLEIDLVGKFGSPRPVRLRVASATAGEKLRYVIRADTERGRYDVTRNDQPVSTNVPFTEPCDLLHRITFRTGGYRNIGGASPVDPQTDRPHDPARYLIRNLRIT
jgi:hypothetical protein